MTVVIDWIIDKFNETATFSEVLVMVTFIPPILKALLKGATVLYKKVSVKLINIINDKKNRKFFIVDSFPKNNQIISKEEIKNIFFKFSKPVSNESLSYISCFFVRLNQQFYCKEHGFLELSDNDQKVLWHIDEATYNRDWFTDTYNKPQVPLFEIRLGQKPDFTHIKSKAGLVLKPVVINVKIHE